VRSEDLRVNEDRFRADFEALAEIGATGDGGVHRPALGKADLAARAWLRERVAAAGLALRVDGAGNHFTQLACGPADAPSLLLGSHLDSVPHGGRFDGGLGVVAALEVLRTAQDAGLALPVHLEAVDFTDEEGTLVGLLGSSALAGTLDAEHLREPRGGRAALEAGLARAGLSEAGLLAARRDPASLAAYLELHVEQGRRLIDAGIDVGVVTAIVGIGSYRLAFLGRADHAGTTPMEARHDAGLGASAFVLAVRDRVRSGHPDCVANVGQVSFAPGAFNIVPARAELALEYRSPRADDMERLGAALIQEAHVAAERFGLGLEVEWLGQHDPAPMHERAQAALAAAAEELGLTHMSLASGAGHDAQSLAGLCPAGMVFVPSVEGASHSPREFTRWEDCVNGANVLLQAALQMAETI